MSKTVPLLVLLLFFAAATTGSAQDFSAKAPPLSPQDSIQTMQVQPGFSVVPVLTEPHIHEPSAVAWDGNGRMYVVEMRAYMQDIDGKDQLRRNGRVSRHEDTDGDGVYDRHTVFADNLSLPRMVLPLRNKVIIRETNTLDLKSYEDTDGDGVADKIELWHEGGNRGGNLEHQPSGLIWNIDNRLYTTYSRHRYRVVSEDQVIREPMPGGAGQWGLTHDDVGRIFYSSAGGENPATDFQRPMIYGPFSLPGEQASGFREVFPIDNVPDTQGGRGRLRKDNTLNRFTASCGQSIFRGDRLPDDFRGDLIICEPVGRLIRRAKVTNDAGRIVVTNAYDRSEFIRSTDPNFRPVNSATGPDGCLYIVDMYRGIIQEGNWVREGSYLREVVKEYELDKNIGRGRIFRVDHTSTKRGPQPRMLDETPAELVAHLSHPNGWWRSEAQKLIVLSGDKSVVPALRTLLTGGTALGRLHALWTLDGLDAVDNRMLAQAMSDPDSRLRSAALRVAESVMEKDRSLDVQIATLADDDDPDVAIQVMLSTARGAHPQAKSLAASVVKAHADNIAVTGIARQMEARIAAMIAEKKKLEEIRRRNKAMAESIVRGKVTYTSLCITCHGADGKGVASPDGHGLMMAPALAGSRRVQGHRDRMLRILLNGLIGPVDDKTYAGGLMLPQSANSDQWIADVATYVRNSFGNKAPLIESVDVKKIRDESKDRVGPWTLAELKRFDPPPFENRRDWKLTASHGGNKVRSAIDGNANSRWDTGTVQRPGMWFQIELPDPAVITSLTLDCRRSSMDYPREFTVHVSADGTQWSEPIGRGTGIDPVTKIEVSAPRPTRHIRIRQTGSSPNKYWSIHDLSLSGLTGKEPTVASLAQQLAELNPADVVAEAMAVGDAARGARVFYDKSLSCAKCHDPAQGDRLGPDLASVRDGVTNVFLAESILRPSKSIRKGFELITVITDEGRTLTGFKVEEDDDVLVLRDPAGGKKLVVHQDEIDEVSVGEISAMPPGLANQLSGRKQFMDLLRFVIDINGRGSKRLQQLKSQVPK